jgi:hypothetical protein
MAMTRHVVLAAARRPVIHVLLATVSRLGIRVAVSRLGIPVAVSRLAKSRGADLVAACFAVGVGARKSRREPTRTPASAI